MNPQDAIDFSREALKTCMMVGGPILVASLLIGLLVGVFQAMTQVQDQTVSFVPKIILLILMIGLCLPWLTNQMLDFSKQAFEKPMTQWAGVSHKRLFPKSKSPATTIENQSDSLSAPANRTAMLPQNPSNSRASQQASQPDRLELLHDKTRKLQLPDAGQSDTPTKPKSPFILPHYRKQTSQSDFGG